MIRKFAVVTIVSGLLLASAAMPGNARPRRVVQTCSGRVCKTPIKRLVPCANDPSRLCVVMRGDAVALGETSSSTIDWQAIPGAVHYQVTIAGYNAQWRSSELTNTSFDYSALGLKPGTAYLVTIVAYGGDGEVLQSIEQAINIPAAKANYQ